MNEFEIYNLLDSQGLLASAFEINLKYFNI